MHSMFATVAVASLELGTFNVIVPPMIRAMIWTASPTDLSYDRSVMCGKWAA
jgi:hypothetical protein